MLAIILIIVFSLLALGGAYFFVFRIFVPKVLEKLDEAAGSDSAALQENLESYDAAIESSIETVANLKPLEEFHQAKAKLEEIEKAIQEEAGKMGKIEKLLGKAQEDVDVQESRHNELKKGKEDCERLADEIRGNQEQLKSESQRLEAQLEESRSHMNSLSGEVELTSDQKAALDQVYSALEKHLTQVQELNRFYELTATRFITLESQYEELEKEYRKLVDKELSGE